MNPKISANQNYCKNLINKSENTRVKFYSSIKTLDPVLINEIIDKYILEFTETRDIQEALRLINELGLGKPLKKLLPLFRQTKDRFLKNEILNVFKKINSPELTLELLKFFDPPKSFPSFNYDIKQILTKNMNKILASELYIQKELYLDNLTSKEILEIFLEYKNPQFWNEIVELTKLINIFDEQSILYRFDYFAPLVDIELVEKLFINENPDVNLPKVIGILVSSGKRRYLQIWLDYIKQKYENIPRITIFGKYQRELFINSYQNSENSLKNKILEYFEFGKDISLLSDLYNFYKSESDPQLRKKLIFELKSRINYINN
jgi:hypothetical protein